MAQFTRFLKPGFQVIGNNDHNTIAAYDKSNRQLTFITMNYGNAQTIGYDLSNFKKVGTSGQITSTTQVSATDEVRGVASNFQVARLAVTNGQVRVEAKPNSIYSIVINGVEL